MRSYLRNDTGSPLLPSGWNLFFSATQPPHKKHALHQEATPLYRLKFVLHDQVGAAKRNKQMLSTAHSKFSPGINVDVHLPMEMLNLTLSERSFLDVFLSF